jgi:ATP-binding cassette, subfamily B, bacterial
LKLPRFIKTGRGKLDFGDMDIVFRRFMKYVRPHWKSLMLAFGATFAVVATQVLSPWPIKIVFDLILSNDMANTAIGGWFARNASTPRAALVVVCAAVVLIALAQALSAYVRDVRLAQTGQEVVGLIRRDLFRHMQRLSPDVFEARRTGDLLMRLTGDIRMLRQMIVNSWVTAGENLLTISVIIVVMFCLNPLLAAVATCTIPLMIWSATRASKKIRHATKSQREKESFVASIAHEVFGAISVVQAFNREKIEQQRFSRQNRSSMRAGVKTTRLEAKLFRVVVLASAAGLCAVLYIGVENVLAGTMTRGDLLVFVAYVRMIHKPLRKLSKLASQTAKATACGKRVAEILNIPPAIQDAPDAIVAQGVQGRIDMDHISFVYPDGTDALCDVSIHVAPSKRVAVVGRSGAGKSTLMKLLLRFYDVTEGAIRIDGTDIRKLTIASLRDQIAVAQQETILFGLTIAENIALGCEEIDEDAVINAAKTVGAHRFIKELPEGYETRLSERGTTLSGGQRQRLAIARALLRPSPILVLDEPATGLDAQSADRAESTVMLNGSTRTTLVICHDLSSMERFDEIVMMEKGRVSGIGRHSELLETCEPYAAMYGAWQARSQRSQEAGIAHQTQRTAC